ncbi:tetratricopeptide repeat-containing sensor histidine kinase [Aurantibacillus circumpalustris]|uniref:tetratricopeptide repeat-containing sensor histidine kinase n=1 Tax=Aurantibacillus circumpalustris TaxID=3036359 RepID=UPI00295BDBC0|nr:sensor histidine kinase [Aurantibacillus circumpalustris]
MKIKQKYVFLFFLLQIFHSKAQLNKAKFQKDFFEASPRTKVRLVAAIPHSELHEVYPYIKDTLDKIKKDIYRQATQSNNDLKFLFDKIEAKKELFNENYGKTIFILENALRYTATNIDDTLTCLSMLKNVFVKIKNVNRAFEMQHIIENTWHRQSDTANIDYGLNKSFLYYMLGFTNEAIEQRRSEFNKLTHKSDTDMIVNFYNDMGVFYNKEKKSDSAEFYFLKAKRILKHKKIESGKEAHYDFYKGLIDGNLAQSYYNKGLLKKAIPLLKQDIYYSIKSENFESAFNSYVLITQCYIDLKEKRLSKLYLDSCETLLANELSKTNLRIKFLPLLAKYYEFMYDYKKAATTYSNYYRIYDSVLDLEKERDAINQGLTFNIEQRELAYTEQESILKKKEENETRQSSYRKSLIAGVFLLLIVIVFLIINNRRFKRREKQLSFKNNQIQDQNKQIEQSLKEKEALIKEIHHRVKNNLQIITSMLNLQIGKIDDEKTESIFFEAKQRINAIALTHQMLYQKTTISNINLVEYIETLVRQIEASMSTSKIEIATDLVANDNRLTIDGAVPLGLIINELLTNCYKHAFPQGKKGLITVSLTENAESFTIKVSDNGIGLPEDFDHEESKTLGMELVFILVEQLESKLIIKNEGGSAFLFDIKKHN